MTDDQINLFSSLTQGRYLIETRSPSSSCLYAWILNDKTLFKHYKYELAKDILVYFNLDEFNSNNLVRKLMYKQIQVTEKGKIEIQKLVNDFNVNNILVSNEQYNRMLEILSDSTNQLTESLKFSNDFYFAII